MISTSPSDLFRRMYALLSRGVWIRKPTLFFRALKTTILFFLFPNAQSNWLMSIALTSKCNLNCQHCFSKKFAVSAGNRGKKELSTDELVSLIHELSEFGAFAFDFQGGEVFLHPDLKQIIEACNPRRSFIGIITNGILLDQTWVERLKEWGVDQVAISVDSAIPEEHDNFRNKPGTWEKAMNAVELSIKAGLRVLVNTTVTHQSLYSEGFRKLSEFCVKRNVVQNVFIGIPIGNWVGRSDILITREDHLYLEQLARTSKGLIRRDLYPRMFRSGCPAIKESVHITEFGDVLPCPFTHVSLGNVREHYVKDIIRRGLTVAKFSQHSDVCLIGQDHEFIAKYGRKTFESPYGPLDAQEVFEFKETLPPRLIPLASNDGGLREVNPEIKP